jgi:hypothetical protein
MINTLKSMGIFVTKRKFIKAVQILTQETVVDKNGEKFVGFPGD